MANINLFGLGGLDERGKNMYVVEVDKQIFIFDAGSKNPERGVLGIDTVIPNFNYLKENKNRIQGIFITKAGDDSSGAIPYILKELDIPIYTTSICARVLTSALSRFKVINRDKNIKIIKAKNIIKFQKNSIEVFATTSNVPDSVGFALHTEDGSIVYTGDYIFDSLAEKRFTTDINHLSSIAKKNVLVLLSEASTASRIDYTAPHHKIKNYIYRSVKESQGRIIFSCFDQDIHKIVELFSLIEKDNLKEVGIYGQTLSEVLHSKNKSESLISDQVVLKNIREIQNFDNSIIIVTGNRERVYSRLIKISCGNDELLEIKETDTIILSTPPIPGSELNHANVLDELLRTEAKVVVLNDRKIWTMTASYEDIKQMTSILRPNYFIPVKGLYKDFVKACSAAKDSGVSPNNNIILDNGDILNINNGKHKKIRKGVKTSDTYVDGIGVGDIGALVLNERKQLATDGVLIVGVTISKQDKTLSSLIDIQMRGVVYLGESNDINEKLQEVIKLIIDKYALRFKNKEPFDINELRNECRSLCFQHTKKMTGKTPIILVIINEV